MKKQLATLLFAVATVPVFAQEVRTALNESGDEPSPALARHLLQVDLIPTLISATSANKPGAGLIYHLRVSQHFGVGAFVDLMTIGSEEGVLFFRDVELERTRYGLEFRGYLSRFGQGFYGAAGPAFANVRARAQARPLNSSAFSVSDQQNEAGFLAKLGYTFGRRLRKNSIVMDLSLEYGAGNRIGYSGTSSGRFEIDEVSQSLTLNAGFGARF